MAPHEHLAGCDQRHTVRQTCNSRGREAVPPHLAGERGGAAAGTAVATAIMSETTSSSPPLPAAPQRGLADGPVETIDTQHVPVLPLIGLALLTLTCVVVLWRLVARGRRD